jgi:selT/selW/selH-like putative selenoprotein
LTAKLLTRFKQKVSRLILVPSDGGRFEVSVGGRLLYSKLEKKVFPAEAALLDDIDRALET